MKSVIKSMKFMGAAVVFLALAACGKSDDNGNKVAAVQYHLSNGSCYDVNNSAVAYNLCGAVAGGYSFNGTGQCVSTSNNSIVDTTYCAQSGYGTAGYPYGTTNGYPYGTTSGYPYGSSYGYGYGSTYGTSYGSAYGYGTNYGYGAGAYTGVQNCTGRTMYNIGGYGAQLIVCGYGMCSGQFLIDIQTKQRVLCQ